MDAPFSLGAGQDIRWSNHYRDFGKGNLLIRVFRSLLYRDYALFWSSDLLGSVGHFVQEVALYWIAYEITGSAMALGILGLCEATPRLILGALGGVMVDCYNRMRLLILIQFAQPSRFSASWLFTPLAHSNSGIFWF